MLEVCQVMFPFPWPGLDSHCQCLSLSFQVYFPCPALSASLSHESFSEVIEEALG